MGDLSIREATHAGSWYTSNRTQLNAQLEQWLGAVNAPITCIGPRSEQQTVNELPVNGARMIIAPHAGYSYSGPAAAWAYKSWDVSKAFFHLSAGSAEQSPRTFIGISPNRSLLMNVYATPLGNLTIDRDTTAELYKTGRFEWMSQSVDEDEHSLEMHLPYIYKMLSRTFGADSADLPPLIPIMVGHASTSTERALGKILAPYLADPQNAFVISSDFAHWGLRFRYTYYQSSGGSAVDLQSSAKRPRDPPIHESIKAVDFECMGACESGSHAEWLEILEDTGNTVCGRHPIGVMMAAAEQIRKDSGDQTFGAFKFVRYERSSEVREVSDSSVSYASAYAVV